MRTSARRGKALLAFSILSASAAMIGCSGRPALFPNSDPNLRKTSTEFAADAAKRHPYPSDLPRAGDALGRASIDYGTHVIELLNYSDQDWHDVDIWVNQNYVCHVPVIQKGDSSEKVLNFTMLYDANGEYFWTAGGTIPVKKLEMVRDGKIYNIPFALAD
ncbi:MAG TPA: hypothetical protein VHY37_10805 [Tepidisphaeraceae bacterium]|jgi:hypothetical protein|nr:hypothetical protein [Tepidisphaeraceae bacterium]